MGCCICLQCNEEIINVSQDLVKVTALAISRWSAH